MGCGLKERDRGRLDILRTFLPPNEALRALNDALPDDQPHYKERQVRGALERHNDVDGRGRPNKYTPRDRVLVKRIVSEYEDLTVEEVSRSFHQQHRDTGVPIRDLSPRTLWRLAQEETLYLTCHAKTGLNKHHRSARESHVRSTLADVGVMGDVLWSDENFFYLFPGTRRKRSRVFCVSKTDIRRFRRRFKHAPAKLMCWGGVSLLHGSLTLQIFAQDETMSGGDYTRILLEKVEPFLQAHPEAVYQQDNASVHRSQTNRFVLRHFRRLRRWPARSPDFSPIGTVVSTGGGVSVSVFR